MNARKCRGAAGNGGFSLFELVVVLTLIGVLIAIAIDKLPAWQAQAERAAAESVVGSLRSALGIKVASFVARGDLAGVVALEGSNPMEQLAEIPSNYVGARRRMEAASVEGGQWYFDPAIGQLVYRVRTGFTGEASEAAELRYTVRLIYEDQNRNGRFDAGRDSLQGVRLEEVQSYAWPG
jgi:prepilin-type N-terminal cleavage/methylation domain-containing protein